MAKTYFTTALSGSQLDFVIPFEFLARKFILVTLIGASERRVLTLNVDYRFTTKNTITLNKAWGPSDGYGSIELRRETSASERLVDFADGSILRSYELNLAQIQSLHIAEETREQTLYLVQDYVDIAGGLRDETQNLHDATEDLLEKNGVDSQLRRDLASTSGAGRVGTSTGETVEARIKRGEDTFANWVIDSDSASYRAMNIAKLGWVDYQMHTRGTVGVLFQGDSLTAGYDRTSTDIVPPENGDWATHASTSYPERFAAFMTEQAGVTINKKIRAISGYTAPQSYNNPDWQSDPECDLAILMLATNDVSVISIDEYMDSMEKLLRRFIGVWRMGVIVCIPSGGGAPGSPWLLYAKRIRNLASIYGCVVFDSQEHRMNRHAGAICSDGLHYNSAGYAMHGMQLASMCMGGGLLHNNRPVTNETIMYPGMISDYYGYTDAEGNIAVFLNDGSYVRAKSTGILPSGQRAVGTFSFYLDAEAAHITAKASGEIQILTQDTQRFTFTEDASVNPPYYNEYNAQFPFFSHGTEITAEPPATYPIGATDTQGATQFIGRIIGRGWHTITFHNNLQGTSVEAGLMNALVVTPVPVGFAAGGLWDDDERKMRIVHSKKFPTPARRQNQLPDPVTLTSFPMRCPTSLLTTGVGQAQGNWTFNYNGGFAKLRMVTVSGIIFEGIVQRVASGQVFKVIETFSNFPTDNKPAVTAQLATSKMSSVYAAGSIATNMPVENIRDANGGLDLNHSNGMSGGMFLLFNIQWPAGSPSDYWTVELEGSDFYNNSEAVFGTR